MNIVRWIIIIFLFYLIYRVLLGWLIPGGSPRPQSFPRNSPPSNPQSVELVQDPYSGVYFPRSEGIASLVDGRVIYFLNAESRDKYLASRHKQNTGGAA